MGRNDIFLIKYNLNFDLKLNEKNEILIFKFDENFDLNFTSRFSSYCLI